MAPLPAHPATNAPLADWFFIAGIDREALRWDVDTSSNRLSALPQPTILEDDEGLSSPTSNTLAAPSSSPRSSQRTSQYSYSKAPAGDRLSVQSIDTVRHVPTEKSGTASNRSSATIKAPESNGDGDGGLQVDFDAALRNFAAQRDSFLADLSFSAGVITPNKPKPRPKTQRIIGDEIPQASGPSASIKSGIGSIRRRISIRDMNSLKRQPSAARQSSVRTSKRMSNYNSVIPNPQPLNADANMHPLKKRFEPVLLDRYPPKTMVEESKRRPPFPDYIPMFTFPNDINVVSADERPRSTWHGFAMTTEDGSKLHGICVILWIPLDEGSSEELERKCEEWRRKNMSEEERELASSLGERLATERANLSRLLARLPSVASGSTERDKLEEQISAVEETIGLMTDMLRPVRHGAASKIDGLTDGETGLWVPRAYGVLGKDAAMTSFWKEWLKAVIVPMTQGKILRVRPSNPSYMWQPLERYVVNMFIEAPGPISSKTQVEIAIRELRLYARREAANEIPGSRNTDIYALFRALSIPNIVVLFEFLLTESRIILLSSYTSMLHLISKALTELLYPFQWHGVFIPVLPARLLQAIEAPCPYIVGIERRYENIELPSDDFVLVDLDQDTIESTTPPVQMPKQQRRKLTSLLQVAAPHHNRMGVHLGPPPYAVETFPFDAFSSETPSLFDSNPQPTFLSKYAGLNSGSFGDNGSNFAARPPIYNAFLQSKGAAGRGNDDRPTTSATTKDSPEPSISPSSGTFPTTPVSKNDSGFALQAGLREKRSGHFSSESFGRRSSSFGTERRPNIRGPSARTPFGHGNNASISTLHGDMGGSSGRSTYAPSVMAPSTYAPSTLAASTIMPDLLYQPVHNTSTVHWAEGHHLQWRLNDASAVCSVCNDRADESGIYKCTGCGISSHSRCTTQICIVCSAAFHPEQIRAAFVRCFASLLYTYRKCMKTPTAAQKKSGLIHSFDMDAFRKSVPNDCVEYVEGLQQTQAFNEFIHERETKPQTDPDVKLFDEVILAKRNRGRSSMNPFTRTKSTNFLSDTSEHLWRTMVANPPKDARHPKDYHKIVARVPAKLDIKFLTEPRVIQGAPRASIGGGIAVPKARRKPVPSMIALDTNDENLPPRIEVSEDGSKTAPA